MGDIDEEAVIEAREVHDKLNTLNDRAELERTTVCFLNYLLAYRRDMPGVEQFVADELSGLASTRYIRQLEDTHAFRQITMTARELSTFANEGNAALWQEVTNRVNALRLRHYDTRSQSVPPNN